MASDSTSLLKILDFFNPQMSCSRFPRVDATNNRYGDTSSIPPGVSYDFFAFFIIYVAYLV